APQPEVRNPFIGTWATADNDAIMIHADTVVLNQPNGQHIPLDSSTCNGVFSFTYATWKTPMLTALLPRQPGLAKNLSDQLMAQTYPVAQLRCDRGDQTYILISDNLLIAIYRDGEIGTIEKLARR
ncbi:MAG TPA: hypothetical protein VGR45_12270, partial [Stellaceae bacterium]|nr:hypothetical protein [Stellaceae bacterium]